STEKETMEFQLIQSSMDELSKDSNGGYEQFLLKQFLSIKSFIISRIQI
ncbi:unnamed protein product, partial [Rotaria sordida]